MKAKGQAPKKAAPISLLLVAAVAKEYAELGRASYNELAARTRATIDSVDVVTAKVVSTATLLAFSAELFAKALVYQRLRVYPQGHNIRAVLAMLPEQTITRLSANYSELLAKKPNLLRFGVAVAQKGDAHSDGKTPPSPAGRLSFDEALSEVSEMFVGMRYLHETFDSGFAVAVDFHSPLLLVDSMWLEFDSFKGPMRFRRKQAQWERQRS